MDVVSYCRPCAVTDDGASGRARFQQLQPAHPQSKFPNLVKLLRLIVETAKRYWFATCEIQFKLAG